ncbi:MAG: hypothetical protein QXV01_11075 [Candidatus Bathyarchaeia archaeon]
MSQPLTFYLNAYEIRPQIPSNPLEAFRIALNMDAETRKHLSFILRENNIVFHYQPSDYFEYKAGFYIYNLEKWGEIIKSNGILSRLEHHKEPVEAISYVVRSVILKMIENKLEAIKGLRKVRSRIDERKFYFSQDLLKDKSSIFGYYRCFVYRVEYIHRPAKKLLLLILPSVLITGKESLEGLIKERKVPPELLLGLPFKVRQEIDQGTRIRVYVGFLENITGDMAIVRPADLTITKTIDVPLKNLYAIGRIDLYRKVVDFLGEDYDLLYNYKGELTFAWKKGKKMENAPLRMKEEVENIQRELFAKKVFPLELQGVTYTLSNDLISPEIREE